MTDAFDHFLNKMRAKGLSELSIKVFHDQYLQLCKNEKTIISENDILPVDQLPEYAHLRSPPINNGLNLISKTVMIKLNGGLGTSMGLAGAKSTLKVRGQETFLDIISKQTIKSKAHLILMNSFSTVEDSNRNMAGYKKSHADSFADFVQNQVPKINQSNLLPAEHPSNPDLAWCPPGHGDLYTAFLDQNILRKLREKGIKWAFISNADNLGATISPKILGYIHENNIPFLMEVTPRTDSDKKGGHLAIDKSKNQLILRERAQCPDSEEEDFQNIERYKFFNTNNIWVDLDALWKITNSGMTPLQLPIILNKKTIDPRNANSTQVFQLETAVGAAIAVIPQAKALAVPRSRFAPVKTTSDLLLVQSDLYEINENFELVANPNRIDPPPPITLDPKYFSMINHFESRFSQGAPSLVKCKSLKIIGDVFFGKNIKIEGHVTISNHQNAPLHIADDTVLLDQNST